MGHGPDQPLPLYALGRSRIADRRWKDAEVVLNGLIALQPTVAENHRTLAMLHRLRRDRRRAEEALLQARGLDPASPDTLADLAELRVDQGRMAEAEELARAALGESAEHADALVVMGHVLLARGDTADAREHALSVLRRLPDHKGAMLLLVSVKARSSWILGLWWRYHTRLLAFGDLAWAVLLATFALKQVAVLAARDLGTPQVAEVMNLVWLVFVVYTWVGPSLFRRELQKELRPVTLRGDF